MSNSLIRPKDRSLSGATTPGQTGRKGDGNDRVPCIPQSSSITRSSQSDYLLSYVGNSMGERSYLSAEIQLGYSTIPADWVATFVDLFYNEVNYTNMVSNHMLYNNISAQSLPYYVYLILL